MARLVALLVVLAGLLAGASALGAAIWQPPTLLAPGVADCMFPCWQGVIPKQTRLDAATGRLAAFLAGGATLPGAAGTNSVIWPVSELGVERLGFRSIWFSVYDGVIQSMLFTQAADSPRFGDVLAAWGEPGGFVFDLNDGRLDVYFPAAGARVGFVFFPMPGVCPTVHWHIHDLSFHAPDVSQGWPAVPWPGLMRLCGAGA